VFNICTATGRSFHGLMLAVGVACGRAPVIASVDMAEAMRPYDIIDMSPKR